MAFFVRFSYLWTMLGVLLRKRKVSFDGWINIKKIDVIKVYLLV